MSLAARSHLTFLVLRRAVSRFSSPCHTITTGPPHQNAFLINTTASSSPPLVLGILSSLIGPQHLYTMAVLFILWWSRCLRFHHAHPSLHLPPPPAILSSTLPPSIIFFLLPPPTRPLPSTISSTSVPPLRLPGLHLRTTSKHLHPSLSLHQLHHLTHPSLYLK